jgi:Sec-independent protein translocase protein TatA
MTSGIGFSEILLILAVIIIFVSPKDAPGLIRRIFKIIAQLRAAVKKFLDEMDVK